MNLYISLMLLVWLMPASYAGGTSIISGRSICGVMADEVDAERVSHESGIELETSASNRIMQLLTTLDGTLAPLFRGLSPRQLNLPEYLRTQIWTHELSSLSWESFAPGDQKLLINAAAQARGQDFWKSRRIEGLTVKPMVEFTFQEPTFLFGHYYAPGTHAVNIGRYFEPYVEFQGTYDMKNLRSIELKVRSSLTAGSLAQGARFIQDSLGTHRHQHVHLVTKVDRQGLQADPIVEPARYGEFFRRVNLLAEMVTIVEEGLGPTKVQSQGVVFFDGASQQMIAGVGQYFSALANGQNPQIRDQFKMGFVGFRGTDTYDQPNLIGIEYRSVNPNSDIDKMAVILNRLQKMMTTKEFGLPRATIESWIRSMPQPDQVGGALMGIWYKQPFARLFQNAHPRVKAAIEKAGLDAAQLEEQFATASTDVRMLFFNWSFDPIVAGRPALLEAIIREQVEVIEKSPRLSVFNTNTVGKFLKNSGLYARVLETFDIPFMN